MKKLVSFGLMAIVLATFTFVSCNKEEDNNAETTKTEESGGNNGTTKKDEHGNDDETTKNEETIQKAQKKLLLSSILEGNSGGTKYRYVTENKYNEQGDPIESETKINGGLSSKTTNYKYEGNVVTYATYSYDYLTGKSQGVSYITEKYKDANRDLLLSSILEGNSGGTKYRYVTENKYNEQGDPIESETKINGGLSSKTTNYKYEGNVVTYTTYSYDYLTGKSQGVSYITEKYTIIDLK